MWYALPAVGTVPAKAHLQLPAEGGLGGSRRLDPLAQNLVVLLLHDHIERKIVLAVTSIRLEVAQDLQPELLVRVSLHHVGERDG